MCIEKEDKTDDLIKIAPKYLKLFKKYDIIKICFNLQFLDNYF